MRKTLARVAAVAAFAATGVVGTADVAAAGPSFSCSVMVRWTADKKVQATIHAKGVPNNPDPVHAFVLKWHKGLKTHTATWSPTYRTQVMNPVGGTDRGYTVLGAMAGTKCARGYVAAYGWKG